MASETIKTDVIIVGAGFVGRALALTLSQEAGFSVVLIDAKPEEYSLPQDERASALSAAVIHMLDFLGVWDDLIDVAHPLDEMIVTDSHVDDQIRPVFLTFDGVTEEGEPFAHMVPNHPHAVALQKRIDAAQVKTHWGTKVASLAFEPGKASITTSEGMVFEGQLIVACDGANSIVRRLAGIETYGWPYDQYGIVATMEHSEAHPHRAEEHFLPSGPFAILPLGPHRSSLVWTEKKAAANALLALSAEERHAELSKRVPPHYGEIELVGPVEHYPLKLQIARQFVAPRLALCGDAAHSIHPLAGQGLNLGLKDVAALAEVVTEAGRLGVDIGSLATLETYQQWRRFDTIQFAGICDALNRLFGVDNQATRLVRQIGLGVVDRLPALKRAFIGESAGLSGSPPKLLRGEPL